MTDLGAIVDAGGMRRAISRAARRQALMSSTVLASWRLAEVPDAATADAEPESDDAWEDRFQAGMDQIFRRLHR